MTFATIPDDHDQALAELQAAREGLAAVRRRAGHGLAGAASVNAAEHRLHVALKRVDALGWEPPSGPDPDGPEAA